MSGCLPRLIACSRFISPTTLRLQRRVWRSPAAPPGAMLGTEFGDVLRRLAGEIEDDRRTLEGIVVELGFRESKAKEAVAWVGEKVGRLKLNGQIRGYSPLSRVLELEALAVGVAREAGALGVTARDAGDPRAPLRLRPGRPRRASPSAERGDRGVPAPRRSRSVRPRRFCSGELTVAAVRDRRARTATTRPRAPGILLGIGAWAVSSTKSFSTRSCRQG